MLNGTYDTEGYKPGERARIAKARARLAALDQEVVMKKPKNQARPLGTKKSKGASQVAAEAWDANKAHPVPEGPTPAAAGATDAPSPEPPITLAEQPITIDADLAASQLRELAELHLEVKKAEARYAEKAEAAKVAKKTVESKTELLLERLQAFTHPPSLPLFDERLEFPGKRMIDGEAPALADATDITDHTQHTHDTAFA